MADLRATSKLSSNNIAAASDQPRVGGGATKQTQAQNQLNTQALIEKRRATLDVRHKYLLEKFSSVLDVRVQDLETSLCMGTKLDLVNEFFKENGLKHLFFFWQKEELSTSSVNSGVASGATGVAALKQQNQQLQQQAQKYQLVVTDGAKDIFQGTGCYFLRTTVKAITLQNVYTEIYFAVFNNSILGSLTSVVKSVIVPALKSQV